MTAYLRKMLHLVRNNKIIMILQVLMKLQVLLQYYTNIHGTDTTSINGRYVYMSRSDFLQAM